MGRQMGGILGPVRGKVSNVVGAQWKETAYFRGYTIPANPNTEAQQAQRAKMTTAVWYARAILGSVINPYWDPFEKAYSGYNRFLSVNVKAMASGTAYESIMTSRGKLEKASAMDGTTYTPANGEIEITWTGNLMGNGLATDKSLIVITDVVNKIAFISAGGATREDGSEVIDIGEGRTAANLKSYLGFYRGTGTSLMVSDSLYEQSV